MTDFQEGETMTKLDAMKTLADAYHHLFPSDAPQEALNILSDKFHYIRRSTLLDDLRPQPICRKPEGFNGRGPTWL